MTQQVPITLASAYVDSAGRLTLEGYRMIADMERRIKELEATIAEQDARLDILDGGP